MYRSFKLYVRSTQTTITTLYSPNPNPSPHIPPLLPETNAPPYLIHLRLVMVVMAAVHGVERVVLVMVMLMVMKAALRAQGLGIGR